MTEFPWRVAAPNTSGGICGQLLEWIETYSNLRGSMLIIGEAADTIEVFEMCFPDITYSTVNYRDPIGTQYFDLNVPIQLEEEYDSVYNQATLEHICRPSIGIENMVKFAKVGGFIYIHTHGVQFPHHGHPIDCVRFFKSFFKDLTRYIPAELIDFREQRQPQHDVYAVYQRNG